MQNISASVVQVVFKESPGCIWYSKLNIGKHFKLFEFWFKAQESDFG